MLAKLKRKWEEVKALRPGRRFQTVHERQKGGPAWVRPLVIAGAVIAFGIGIVLAVIPGPAFVFFGIAGALAAMESKSVARGLDRTEVVLRRWFRKLKSRWRARFKTPAADR